MYLAYTKTLSLSSILFFSACSQYYIHDSSDLVPTNINEVYAPDFTWTNYETVWVEVDIINHPNTKSIIELRTQEGELLLKRMSSSLNSDQFEIRLNTSIDYELTIANSLGQSKHSLSPTQTEKNFQFTSQLNSSIRD